MPDKQPTPVSIVETKEPIPVIVKKRFSDTVIIAIITGVVSLISLYMTLKVKTKVDTVHQQINSRMDELLEVNKALSRELGIKEGKAKQVTSDSLSDTKK